MQYHDPKLMRPASVLTLTFLLPLAALAQTPNDVVQSLIGKQFILVHLGSEAKIKLKKSQLSQITGSCDIAVSVSAGDWAPGRVRLTLQRTGRPSMLDRPKPRCVTGYEEIVFELSGLAADEPANTLSASLHEILQTPEEYLASNGIHFDLPPTSDDEDVPKQGPPVTHPVLLLRVDGVYTDIARQNGLNGSVVLSFIVGTDGRVHKPQVARGIGSGLDENALAVLPLWRFEPARQEGRTVASGAQVVMTFKIL